MELVTGENNIQNYLSEGVLNHIIHTPNRIDYDFFFIRNTNKELKNMTNAEILEYLIEKDFTGLIHPKQLYNLFGSSLKIMKENDNIVVNYNNKVQSIDQFLKYFNNLNYEDLKKLTIQEEVNLKFNSNKILFLVYIGNIIVGKKLIDKIKKNKLKPLCSYAFCIRNNIKNEMIYEIKRNFNDSYIIYSSNELGNDITPSLLMYDEISKQNKFEYIIKTHTKGKSSIFNVANDYILDKRVENLMRESFMESSCIGYRYVSKESDVWNKKLYKKFENLIQNKYFVPATIFLTKSITFEKVLVFFKNNYKKIFLQNMYDNNMVNKNNSYVHFLERLFGYIK